MLEAKTIREIQAEIADIAFNEMMEADEIFDTLDRMCEVTE
jgi:hypothetical protein